MGLVLHGGCIKKCQVGHGKFGHGHSHGEGGHGHSHDPEGHPHVHIQVQGQENRPLNTHSGQTNYTQMANNNQYTMQSINQPCDVNSGHMTDFHQLPNHSTDGREVAVQEPEVRVLKAKRNINVRAAMVHVIGDLVQSIGVLIAAIIIKVKVGGVLIVAIIIKVKVGGVLIVAIIIKIKVGRVIIADLLNVSK